MKDLLRYVLKSPYDQLVKAREKWRYRSLWRRQLSFAEGNTQIARLLSLDEPCLVGRIGHTEGRIVGEYFFRGGAYSQLTKKQAHQNAGIFPVTPELLSKFSVVYAESIEKANMLGFWQTAFQARLLSDCYQKVELAPLAALEPYLQETPWSAGLEDRRVLVVHPFAASIRHQYLVNREYIFENKSILPLFDLEILAPPQTLAPLTGGYANWLDALDSLIQAVLALEFDVALLGCGAYGLPLGAAIKEAGKKAIHLGGALQVLFGIRGRRWELMPPIAALMNEYWVRPSSDETPPTASLVDQRCYW